MNHRLSDTSKRLIEPDNSVKHALEEITNCHLLLRDLNFVNSSISCSNFADKIKIQKKSIIKNQSSTNYNKLMMKYKNNENPIIKENLKITQSFADKMRNSHSIS